GPRAPGPHAGRRRPARLPRQAGVGVDRPWGGRLRGHDERPGRAARAPRRGGPVLDADRRPPGRVARRHDQDALPHPGRPADRGGAHALPRRAPVDLRVLAVGLPADLHVLRHRQDEVRPQPDGRRDPRPGPALPAHRARRPPRLHGHGRADDEPRRRARLRPAPARDRHHPPAHDGQHGRLAAGHRAAHRGRRAADPARVQPPRARRRAALADHAGQRALAAGRRPRRLRALARAPAQEGLHRVRDARRRQRRPRAGPPARRAARPADLQGQPDPVQPDRLGLRRQRARRDRRLPGRALRARPGGHGPPDPWPRHRRGVRPARRRARL
ncbi:MAG: 23S rRNA (adenine(2503)-C(2))-methyltransferase @ tRNA (adenine(37)-C(2))-methyltransferase, partial [uncultured Solirubrobacteraceae bacterium]